MRGISQTDLALAVGTTKRTIYAIEVENADLHMSLARKLSSFFGCSIEELFIFDDRTHSTADKAIWFTHVTRFTAEQRGESVRETVKLLEQTGLAGRILAGYDVWHTQGYEYLAEMLADEISRYQGE